MELTPAIRFLLAEVANYHRDRDEAVWQEVAHYLLPEAKIGSPSSRARYEEAVLCIGELLRQRGPSFLELLDAEIGLELTPMHFPPRTLSHLERVTPEERCAHVIAIKGSVREGSTASHEALFTAGLPEGSRVHSALPDLSSRLTPRDLLLRVGSEIEIEPDAAWVNYRGNSLQLHPGLRRGFGAGRVNYTLWDLLARQMRIDVEVAVAIDSSRICPKGQLLQFVEADRWFGAPLDLARLDDPSAVGATLHERVKSRGLAPDEKPGLRTEARWSFRDGLKTLEIEELPQPGDSERVVCRYVHAIRSVADHRFIHLDGALHVYTGSAFRARYSQAASHGLGKVWADQKVKLFRLDARPGCSRAEIPLVAWREIITLFFRGNELVLEYLTGRSFDDLYRETYGREYPSFG